MSARRPLSSRPLDLLYFIFFLVHLPASLLLDCQSLYPSSLVPSVISQLPGMYIQLSGDPLISGAMGQTDETGTFVWFKTFLFVEMFFQVPVFILGMIGLFKDTRSIYVLLLIYGASTATTTLPCLSVLLSTPVGSAHVAATGPLQSLTVSQYYLLLSSYLPFFLIPLLMTVDMAIRVGRTQGKTMRTVHKKSQ